MKKILAIMLATVFLFAFVAININCNTTQYASNSGLTKSKMLAKTKCPAYGGYRVK